MPFALFVPCVDHFSHELHEFHESGIRDSRSVGSSVPEGDKFTSPGCSKAKPREKVTDHAVPEGDELYIWPPTLFLTPTTHENIRAPSVFICGRKRHILDQINNFPGQKNIFLTHFKNFSGKKIIFQVEKIFFSVVLKIF